MAKFSIVLGITGGIAAYKSVDLVSKLKKASYDVNVILTENGSNFVTPLSLETLSGNPVDHGWHPIFLSGITGRIDSKSGQARQ